MYNIKVILKAFEEALLLSSVFACCVCSSAKFKTNLYSKFFRFLATTAKKRIMRTGTEIINPCIRNHLTVATSDS